jgi:hypothetical protein
MAPVMPAAMVNVEKVLLLVTMRSVPLPLVSNPAPLITVAAPPPTTGVMRMPPLAIVLVPPVRLVVKLVFPPLTCVLNRTLLVVELAATVTVPLTVSSVLLPAAQAPPAV